jgi:hypothetical protein
MMILAICKDMQTELLRRLARGQRAIEANEHKDADYQSSVLRDKQTWQAIKKALEK